MTGWAMDPAVSAAKLDDYIEPSMGVEVGILANAQDYPDSEDGTSRPTLGYASKVVMVAHFHEISPESNYNKWLLKAIEAGENEQTRAMMKLIKKSKDNAQKRLALMAEFGDMVAQSVQKAIESRAAGLAPNHPATLAVKQGSVPMIDTKHLISVIDSETYSDG